MSTREAPHAEAGVFGKYYAEVLLIRSGQPDTKAAVYLSSPLDDFPNQLWSELDPQLVAAEHGVDAVVLDGPRCWLMNSIEQAPQTPPVTKTFGGIEMRQQGTISLPASVLSGMDAQPYVAKQVDRKTIFTFDTGHRIYELVDPVGRRWVMQSFSQIMDVTLTLADLRALGDRLMLPPGWAYRSQTLTTPLRMDSMTHPTPIILDALGNIYSLLTGHA
ncbi:MAG: hypothetical protein K2Q25_02640 [Mycobacteriaceae bacterium]|nr:hypothetical protein [Mycobacteriaceae bacterium]